MNTADAERIRIAREFPDEFCDGARCGFLKTFPGARQAGGYPLAFHRWPIERRNAWLAGFNRGFHDHLRFVAEHDHG
jgi:hypothetical protein